MTSPLTAFASLLYRPREQSFIIIKTILQIDSMLPCVCSVIDHRRLENMVRTSVTHSLSDSPRVPFFVLTHFDVICDLLPEQTHGNMEFICKLVLIIIKDYALGLYLAVLKNL